jgi:hypothetical protein
MTERKTSESRKPDPVPDPMTDPITEAMSQMARMQAATFGPMSWMGPASVEAFQATVQEVSEFVSQRLQKDLDTQKALLGSRTLQEVQQIQSKALQDAFDDYRVEAERLSGIARSFMEHAARTRPDGKAS